MSPRTILSALILASALGGCGNEPQVQVTTAPVAVAQPAAIPKIEVAADDIVLPVELDEYGIMFSGRKSRLGIEPEPHGGGWNEIEGRIVLDATATSVKDVQVTFDMNTLWTDHDGLTETLKNNGWFEVEKFPTATFQLARITDGGADRMEGATHLIEGHVTLHGVTRLVSFPVKVELSSKELHLTSQFELLRSDFGIDGEDSTGLAAAVGDVVWNVHDEVGVELDFVLPVPEK